MNLCIKILILFTLFVAIVSAGDLRFESRRYETLAYIRADGRIEDASFQTLGYIRDDERIENAVFETLGYIRDGKLEDDNYNELYRLTSDGRLTDSHFMTLAKITPDGTVEDDMFNVLLYTEGSDDSMTDRIAIYLVFFSDLLEDAQTHELIEINVDSRSGTYVISGFGMKKKKKPTRRKSARSEPAS